VARPSLCEQPTKLGPGSWAMLDQLAACLEQLRDVDAGDVERRAREAALDDGCTAVGKRGNPVRSPGEAWRA